MSNCHSSWPPHHPLITPWYLVPVPVSTATLLSAPVTSDHCPPRPPRNIPQTIGTNTSGCHGDQPSPLQPPYTSSVLTSSTECNL